MKQAPARYSVPSVDTAAQVLALLSRYRSSACTLSEICRTLNVAKTTCLRVLKTLESHGMLRYDADTRRYSLGYFCVVLGARAEESLDYLGNVRPLLSECARRTGLTAAFAQRVSADRLMYTAKHQGGDTAHLTISVGNRFPITATSFGKWVLALTDEADRDRVLADGLPQMTPHTTTDIEKYRAQLEKLEPGGVIVSRSEYVPGVLAVSCPVINAHRGLLGVLAVLGLTEAVSDGVLDSLRTIMRDISARCTLTGSITPRPTP